MPRDVGQIRLTCVRCSSIGVSRPKTSTATTSLPPSSRISEMVPTKSANGPSLTRTLSPMLKSSPPPEPPVRGGAGGFGGDGGSGEADGEGLGAC